MPSEPWYETVNADQSITQGDLIFNCPILSWKYENLGIQDPMKMKFSKEQWMRSPLM